MSLTEHCSDDCTGSAGSLIGQTLNNGLGGSASVTWSDPSPMTWARDGAGFATLTGNGVVHVAGDTDAQDCESGIVWHGGSGGVLARWSSGNHLLAYNLVGTGLYLYNKTTALLQPSDLGTLSSGQRLDVRPIGPGDAATVSVHVDGSLRGSTTSGDWTAGTIPDVGVGALYTGSVLEISGFDYLTDPAPPATQLSIDAPTTSLTERAITVTVTVQDAGGSTVTGNTDTVTITPHLLTLTGQFAGTLSVAAVAGVATFSLTFTGEQGATYTYEASSGSLTHDTTSTITNSVRSLVETAVTIS